jgi:hypothetical protein
MNHHCHAFRCKTATKPELFMCAYHWRRVPSVLKARIWAHYRPGQCDDKRITSAYSDAAKASIMAVAKSEGHVMSGKEPELELYDLCTAKGPQLGLFGSKDD